MSSFALKVPTSMDAFMLYGPVVSDGYGICYNPHPDYMIFVVTAFHREEKTISDQFAATLVESLQQMKDICIKGSLENGKTTENNNIAITNGS